MCIYSNRKVFALSEHNFTLNLYRIVIEKFNLKVWLKHDTEKGREQAR